MSIILQFLEQCGNAIFLYKKVPKSLAQQNILPGASKVYILELFPYFFRLPCIQSPFLGEIGSCKKRMFLHCFLLEKIVFKCKNKRSYNEPDYFRTCFKSIVFNFGIKTLSDSFDGLLLKYLPNWSVWKKQVNFRFPC